MLMFFANPLILLLIEEVQCSIFFELMKMDFCIAFLLINPA